MASGRWSKLAAAGSRQQRLRWASTGTKDPKAPDTLYIEALAAPDTSNTMPEKTLRAFADHGKVRGAMAEAGGICAAKLEKIAAAGVAFSSQAARVHRTAPDAVVTSWNHAGQRIDDKPQSRHRSAP